MSGYIYAIGCGRFVKIGFSGDPIRRFENIAQVTPETCELLGVTPASISQEKRLHECLWPWRVRGEWYPRESGIIKAFVATLRPFDPAVDEVGPPQFHRVKSGDVGLDTAIARSGTARALADALGITQQALSQWKRVPVYRILDVERITGVSRTVLRPDVHPPVGAAA